MQVCWNITSKCNCKCCYCFKFDKDDLAFDKNLEILYKLKEQNIDRITWTGGEPYLYKDLNKLINYSNEVGIKNYVNTNAVLLTKENLKDKLKNVDKIIISLDFVDDNLNEINGIGKNYYRHIKQLLPNIKKIYPNIEVQINTVVFKNNIEKIDDIYSKLIHSSVDCWKLIRFFPTRGMAYERKHKLEITDEEFEGIKRKYYSKKQEFNIIIHGLEEMSKKHIIVLSCGSLIHSENYKDFEIKEMI